MRSLSRIPSFQALAFAVLASISIVPRVDAATLTKLQSPAPLETTPKVVLPSRDAVLVIDWVDAKTDRIAIGGLTYTVRTARPRIVLAGGEEVTTIGYLKAGMRARIQTADERGTSRLVEIRVEP